jgi:hypothetical protein
VLHGYCKDYPVCPMSSRSIFPSDPSPLLPQH